MAPAVRAVAGIKTKPTLLTPSKSNTSQYIKCAEGLCLGHSFQYTLQNSDGINGYRSTFLCAYLFDILE